MGKVKSHGRATISNLSMLEATDFIQINFLGKLSRYSLPEKYQLRDKKILYMRKPLVYFFALKNRGGGESTFLESETCTMSHDALEIYSALRPHHPAGLALKF